MRVCLHTVSILYRYKLWAEMYFFNWFVSSLCLQTKTCEHSRGVSALILPNKVAHVTRGVAGSK